MPEIEVSVSGPLFNGLGAAAARDLVHDIRHEVSRQVLADVHHVLNARIQHPTPYYETQINIREGPDVDIVNDRRIVYGPWLEGTSRRNQTTRFKGYHAFRLARQASVAKVPRLVQAAARRAVARMGGTP